MQNSHKQTITNLKKKNVENQKINSPILSVQWMRQVKRQGEQSGVEYKKESIYELWIIRSSNWKHINFENQFGFDG